MASRGPSDIPAELQGREVSVRQVAPFIDAARTRHYDLRALVAGTDLGVDGLHQSRERISWATYCRLCTNLGRLAGTEAELVRIGTELMSSPVHRALVVPGRLLFSLPDIFRWGVKPDGPIGRLQVTQTMHITQLSSSRLRLETTMKPPYECVREFWLLRLGFLKSVSAAFGLPLSDVVMTAATPTAASYDITLPADRSLVGRVRQRTTWLFAARDAATELSASNDALYQRNLDLQREVDARKAAEAELQILNAQLEARVAERTRDLEQANRELTLFNASVAHDLRAPLRAIKGFTAALGEDHAAALDPAALALLARISTSADRMAALVDALLSLSRVTLAEMTRVRVDLGEVAKTVIEDLRATQPARDVELAIDRDLIVDGDPALVRALVQNLVGNAWKFTRDRHPAHIAITHTTTPAGHGFQVRDNGAGFDAEHAAGLFTPFQRFHPHDQFDGSGIGLAIVQRVVQRHGGQIWADAAQGQGATFSFTLQP